MRIEDLFWIGFVGGGLSLLFAFLQLGRLLPLPVVGEPAQGLAVALSKGTNAYLKWQLLLSAGGLMLVAGLLAALAYCGLWSWLAPLALLSGDCADFWWVPLEPSSPPPQDPGPPKPPGNGWTGGWMPPSPPGPWSAFSRWGWAFST